MFGILTSGPFVRSNNPLHTGTPSPLRHLLGQEAPARGAPVRSTGELAVYHNLGSGRPTSSRDFKLESTLGQPFMMA